MSTTRDPEPIFSCDLCSRQYSSQTTLLRHRNSHDRNKWHSCLACNLRFPRRDILVRHEQIHQSHSAKNLSRKNLTATPSYTRKRAARACDECRRSKVRCNGGHPCASCQRGRKKCLYQSKSVRLSLQDLDESNHHHHHHHHHNPPLSQQPDDSSSSASPEQNNSLSADLSSLQLPASDIPIDPSNPVVPSTTLVDTDLDTLMSADIMLPNTWSEQVPWPWLHEDTFLQNPTFPELPALSGFDADPYESRYASGDSQVPQSISEAGAYLSLVKPQSYSQPALPDSHPTRGQFPALAYTSEPRIATAASDTSESTSIDTTIIQKLSLDINQGSEHNTLERTTDEQIQVVNDLVHDAAADLSLPRKRDPVIRSRKRAALSREIGTVFAFSSSPVPDDASHLLHAFVTSFFENFYPLWPMSWRQGFDYDAAEPLLYLTMSSIGAMYAATPRAAAYGLTMHQMLRPVLISACLKCPEDDVKLEAVFEALLLTELMSLYFGQSQAFAYAQQASAVLACHARRIGLFRDLLADDDTMRQCDEKLVRWIRMERRRRLAFGLFRCEVILSILLNTRPLVSYEELNLETPCSNDVWTYTGPSWRQKLLTAIESSSRSPPHFYSDLVRIAMDQDEALPVLPVSASELVLYGLQIPLWTFCQDHDLFDRLPRKGRQMNGIRRGYLQTTQALDRWKTCYMQPESHGRTALSSRLLYHVGYLRLHADLEMLHMVSYQRGSTATALQRRRIQKVHAWARSDKVTIALDHACQIWSLINDFLPGEQRRYPVINLLSPICLHHAAVVVWVFAGTHTESEVRLGPQLRVIRANTRELLSSFADLLRRMNPAWRALSSLALAAEAFSKRPFPLAATAAAAAAVVPD